MLLTPLRNRLSFATLACLATRPPLLRLRTTHSLVQRQIPSAQPHSELFPEQCHTPSTANKLLRYQQSLTLAASQAIQTP
jgi:hypothetical protein